MLENSYSGRRVLVTGDTGFKGAWLCAWLVKLGAQVAGYALREDGQNLFYRAGLGLRVNHIDGDVRRFEGVSEAFENAKPEVVFHLAAQPLVLESYRRPLDTLSSNIMGTAHVLEASRKSPSVKAVVIITSDKCYENQERLQGYRETDPLGGADPYSASKGAAEIVSAAYAHSFMNRSGAPLLATARAGNVIGGGDWAAHRIVPDCIRSLVKKEAIQVRRPEAIRPWQHVLEPLRGYLMLGAQLLEGNAGFVGPWNFGPLPRNLVPVRRLVDAVVKRWGSGEVQTSQPPAGEHEATFLHLDITKALTLLKWQPALDFEQTVAWTVEEYRGILRPGSDALDVVNEQIERYHAVVETLGV